MQITEIKRHPEGREHRFKLDLVLQRPHLVIGSFTHTRPRHAGGFAFERGALSYGFFWKRRPYVMYRMLDASGILVANRFDVVEDVHLAEGAVSYMDLYLDLWVGAGGTPQFEDEDEVDDARRDGTLSNAQLERINQTRDLLLRRHRIIAREAAALLVRADLFS